MWKRKRTEITLEIHEVFRIRRAGGSVRALCAECAAETRMVTPEEAVVLTRASTRTIYALVEAGRIHFIETAEGSILVCLNSLLK